MLYFNNDRWVWLESLISSAIGNAQDKCLESLKIPKKKCFRRRKKPISTFWTDFVKMNNSHVLMTDQFLVETFTCNIYINLLWTLLLVDHAHPPINSIMLINNTSFKWFTVVTDSRLWLSFVLWKCRCLFLKCLCLIGVHAGGFY